VQVGADRGQEPGEHAVASASSTNPHGVALDVAERVLHGAVLDVADDRRDRSVSDAEEHRDGFGCREREVVGQYLARRRRLGSEQFRNCSSSTVRSARRWPRQYRATDPATRRAPE
jgi:hypothetical protein